MGRVTEVVKVDQEIEVKVLHIDREKQKIALGLKQKSSNPWDTVEEKYPVDTMHRGSVVNVMSYGAFVKLEPGIEGLVHISEMSWTKRINHPNELVNIGDEIDVKILGVDPEGQQLSLGMKQTQKNPWDEVLERYPEALGSDAIRQALDLDGPRPALVRQTTDPRFGDFQINGAMKLGKELGRPPRELAQPIAEALQGVDAIDKAVSSHGLVVPAIGTGQAWGEEGLSFTSDDASVRAAAIAEPSIAGSSCIRVRGRTGHPCPQVL